MSWVIRWCAGAKLYEQRFDSELAGRAMVRKKEAPAVNRGKSSMENLRVVLSIRFAQHPAFGAATLKCLPLPWRGRLVRSLALPIGAAMFYRHFSARFRSLSVRWRRL